ncbi:MAG: NUDIX hydrolase YfcD [Proteobacteria bacterium]|nr:NUDIX hydrolase YfcD [Pseudomonadota bacterium]MBU1738595.1 NUDIX hydrolase YfcD [Pseudomonadota bacterium]
MGKDEKVVIVDLENRVIGHAPRWVMREEKLIHRATYILVFNRRGELYVQKRTMTKDIYPGFYDLAAGGVVLDGESYDESARRELLEELGVSPPLNRLFDHFYSGPHNQVWGRVYSCLHDGPFVLQVDEVESACFMRREEVVRFSGDHDFTPDGIEIFARYMAEKLQ